MERGAAPLTDRQRAVLSEINRYRQANGEGCTVSYLARRIGIDESTMREHLEVLHRNGWLRAPGQAPELSRKALPPLPIPPRDEEEVKRKAPSMPPDNLLKDVVVERRMLPGQRGPSTVVVRTKNRTYSMKVLRSKGQVVGFVVDDAASVISFALDPEGS